MCTTMELDKENPIPLQEDDVMSCYNEDDKTMVQQKQRII